MTSIKSDTEADIAKDDGTPLDEPQEMWMSYDIFEFIDQSKVLPFFNLYGKLLNLLGKYSLLNIFTRCLMPLIPHWQRDKI